MDSSALRRSRTSGCSVRWLLSAAVRTAVVVALCGALAPIAEGQSRSAVVSGVVRDSAGQPVSDVEVSVVGAGVRARTDDEGAFVLPPIMAGPATLVARRLGYGLHQREMRLTAGEGRSIVVVLSSTPGVLESVNVTARAEPFDSRLAGFNARSARRVGHFVTRERIDRSNSTTVIEMLREIPGVRIAGTRAGVRSVRLRNASCPPVVFVDGFPAGAGEFDLDIVDLQSLEGVEVYNGIASVPPEFTTPRDLHRCGVIALWSRPARPRARDAIAARRTDDAVPKLMALAIPSISEVHSSDQVEQGAKAIAVVVPSYPDSLLMARTSGRVVVEVIVDTAGRVEEGSVDVLFSSDERFTRAVRAALVGSRFTPALAGGHRVRQFLQLPFVFAPGADATGQASPAAAPPMH
jgi:TonB family protein